MRRAIGHRVEFKTPATRSELPFVTTDKGKIKYTCWYAPLDALSLNVYMRVQIGHFFLTVLSSWLAIFASLMIGASFGNTIGILPPNIGVYGLLIGLAHVPPLYIAFNVRTWKFYDVRINPYISLVEWCLHGAIGFLPFIVEILAQVIGAVIASALVYGVLNIFSL